MSTEHQQYSTENQSLAILQYAQAPDMEIVRTKIPKEAKQTILRQLDRININESSLFPEIEKAALYIMSQLTPVAGGEVGA